MESSTTSTGLIEEDDEGFVVLDGRVLEGGQILRNSVSYSALLRRKLRITGIFAERRPPGLKMQHLKGIQLVQELSRGELMGGEVSSTSISFTPGDLQAAGTATSVDIQTAGSITLVIQTVLPVLLFQPPKGPELLSSVVTLLGGTNATQAPQIDYFLHVFLPVAEKMFGVGRVSCKIPKRGYYPKGGGEVQLEVLPLAPGESLRAIDLTERGEVTKICGYIFAGGTRPKSMALELHRQALMDLELAGFGKNRFPGLENDLRVVKESKATGGGCGLLLWAQTEGGCVIAGSALEEHTKKFGSAREATTQLVRNLSSGVCVDEFLQDQLIILMALAKGSSKVMAGPITLHTRTAILLAQKLTGVTFQIQKLDGGLRSLIQCHGIGFTTAAAEPIDG